MPFACQAAQPCLTPAEAAAFGVAALKSEMMVVAISCGAQDGYNAAVTRSRAEMHAHEDTLSGWFVRAYGARARAREDDYITQLANARSTSALAQGAEMCGQQEGLFKDIETLAPGGMAAWAASRNYPQPVRLVACAADGHPATALAYDAPQRPAARTRAGRSAHPASRHR